MTQSATGAADTLGIIEVSGDEAGPFLRAQLTNDIDRLGPDRHFLASWCDARGRALMIARVIETGDRYLLVLPAELVETVLKRLRMFVLRAKVALCDVSADFHAYGLAAGTLPPANHTEIRDSQLVLGLPCAAGQASRALVLAPAQAPSPGSAIAIDSSEWKLQTIDAGIPMLYAVTQGLFVPQMLNLHWLWAIDFDKGCYPGQEVIARLHYRGNLNRRLYRMAWRGDPPMPGTDVVDDDGARQGTVIQSAGTHQDGRLLAVLKTHRAAQPLRTEGARLDVLDLPYATPA